MLYLIKCEISKLYYHVYHKSEMSHIVEAESEQYARDKVQDFYLKKDSEFWVHFNYCNEVIK